MVTRILSTTAYSRTTRSVDSNLGAATELDERIDAECLASPRNEAACWTVGGISGRIAEPEAVLAFQRTLVTPPGFCDMHGRLAHIEGNKYRRVGPGNLDSRRDAGMRRCYMPQSTLYGRSNRMNMANGVVFHAK
ncbi:unnamed protein product [Phytophthora fragariaefolia]|uniref:Unnamed protein product n=1 Tax=Phytophthora fragariaefolia TaxID=1490495 RepID=A0A9W7D0R8_9STRA|nr:unnamed protein product [Phytophthora fragariaefolia]